MEKQNQSDNNYTNGCVYQYLTYLQPGNYNYTYSFKCSDGKYSKSTILFNDLEVIEENLYEPYLLKPKVSPEKGLNSTIFNFTVWYYDDENNFPVFVNISINDTIYSMLPINISEILFIVGLIKLWCVITWDSRYSCIPAWRGYYEVINLFLRDI